MLRLRTAAAVAAGLVLAATPTVANAATSGQAPLAAPAPATDSSTNSVPPDGRVLGIQWEQEKKLWWCGPAASRMALKSWVANPMSQAGLADLMVEWNPPWPWNSETPNVGHARDGMNQALENSNLPARYVSAEFDDSDDLGRRTEVLRDDVLTSIGLNGHAMVVNIASRPDNKIHAGYPDRDVYHYITVYGYDHEGDNVYISDPVSALTDDYAEVPQKYTVSTEHLAEIMHDGDDSDQYYAYDPGY